MATKTKRKPTRAATPDERIDHAKRAKQSLKAAVRWEREINGLVAQLMRRIRQNDARLLELGGALMARAARLDHAGAARDVAADAGRTDAGALIEG